MPIATTARLELRQVEVCDAEFLWRLMNDPAWIANIGDRGVGTISQAEQYIQTKMLPGYQQNGFGLYLVAIAASAQPIGLCGLVRREGLSSVDMGFAFLPDYRGKGYAFESAAAVMAFARSTLGIDELLAIVTPTNQASIGLLEKLGFRYRRDICLASDRERLRLYQADSPPRTA
jgi:RimJ/RimL family protein N-acetyltransferase